MTSDEVRALVDRARVMAQESAANGFVATAADLGRFAEALETGLEDAERFRKLSRIVDQLGRYSDGQVILSVGPDDGGLSLVWVVQYAALIAQSECGIDLAQAVDHSTEPEVHDADLDGPPNPLASAAASTERRLTAGNAGYRDAEPGVPDPTPQDVGDCADGPLPQLFEMAPINITGGMDPADFLDPDGARMDTLEDLVRQSAKRGECVVIDGRGSGTTVEWWPETASDGQPMHVVHTVTNLREALDKAKEGERGE